MAKTDHLMIDCDETHLRKMRMALAEVGYTDLRYLGLTEHPRTGLTTIGYWCGELPDEVAWQAYNTVGIPTSCLACFLARNKSECESATGVWDRDCGIDRG